MNKNILRGALLLVFLLILASAIHAESLDEEQARYAAAAFFSPSSPSSRLRAKGRQLVLRSEGHEGGCYIFERPEGGVVFVADDDAVGRTVLGYTDGGCFDARDLPIGLQDWLGQVGVLMDAVHEGRLVKSDVRRRAGSIVVPALLQTYWNQGAPYNNLCPTVEGERCLTGCVATAMAQVMKYWEWPEHGYGSVIYDDTGCGQTLSTDLANHVYDWENMLNGYHPGSYTEAQATAVATLMRDCGYAVQMSYTPYESGATLRAATIQRYFHYDASAKERYREDYPEEMWHAFIQQDLQARHPVLYSGFGMQGGHEFILDGFTTEDYYHVNWGWGSNMDGWFMLTDLNDFNQWQWMISNLIPDRSADEEFVVYSKSNDVLTIKATGSMSEMYQLKNAPWREECDLFRKIVFSEGLTSIVEGFGYAYENDRQWRFSNLEEVVLPEGLLSIGQDAFLAAPKLTTVRLPSTLLHMDYAFFGCESLRSLHLPKSLEEFTDILPNLSELTVDEENPFLCAKDNVLYSKDGKHLLFVPQGLKQVTISETTKEIADVYFLKYCIPIVSKCMTAPKLPTYVIKNPALFDSDRGYLYIPYGSTGYESWISILPSGWKVIYYNIDRIPEMKITWALDEGTLTLSGWGEQQAGEYEADLAPYYPNRSGVQQLVVDEGITGLCQRAFHGYGSLTEADLPSTLCYIDSYCFGGSGITTISCHARQAPTLGSHAFTGMPQNGTLRVPEGSDYSAWLNALPSGWRIEQVPEVFATCYLHTGESVYVGDMKEWNELLASYPNAVGIINPRYEELLSVTHNILTEDATAEGGYRCPDFRLTDLSYGYATADKAPMTGFYSPVSFSVTKGKYIRKLTEGYNTVCLPFAFSKEKLPKDCQIYSYSHFDSDISNAFFVPQTTAEAGQGYILKCDMPGVEWQADLSDKTIVTRPASTGMGNMRGTFVSTENYQGIGYSPRAKDNVFAPLAQYLHPFRACFIINSPSAPAEVRICLSDEADGISLTPALSQGEGVLYKQGSTIVNLAGQKIVNGKWSNGKLRRGVNIVDGKIVIR